jgi:hypothetical protein
MTADYRYLATDDLEGGLRGVMPMMESSAAVLAAVDRDGNAWRRASDIGASRALAVVLDFVTL